MGDDVLKENNEKESLISKYIIIGYVIGTVLGFLLFRLSNSDNMIKYVGFGMLYGAGLGSAIGMLMAKNRESEK